MAGVGVNIPMKKERKLVREVIEMEGPASAHVSASLFLTDNL